MGDYASRIEIYGIFPPGTAEWEIPEDQIEICLLPDGSEHLLGRGSYGAVHKGILRGE